MPAQAAASATTASATTAAPLAKSTAVDVHVVPASSIIKEVKEEDDDDNDDDDDDDDDPWSSKNVPTSPMARRMRDRRQASAPAVQTTTYADFMLNAKKRIWLVRITSLLTFCAALALLAVCAVAQRTAFNFAFASHTLLACAVLLVVVTPFGWLITQTLRVRRMTIFLCVLLVFAVFVVIACVLCLSINDETLAQDTQETWQSLSASRQADFGNSELELRNATRDNITNMSIVSVICVVLIIALCIFVLRLRKRAVAHNRSADLSTQKTTDFIRKREQRRADIAAAQRGQLDASRIARSPGRRRSSSRGARSASRSKRKKKRRRREQQQTNFSNLADASII
jgi:hypothetical protein